MPKPHPSHDVVTLLSALNEPEQQACVRCGLCDCHSADALKEKCEYA